MGHADEHEVVILDDARGQESRQDRLPRCCVHAGLGHKNLPDAPSGAPSGAPRRSSMVPPAVLQIGRLTIGANFLAGGGGLWVLRARIFTIFEGTSEIQRMIVGRSPGWTFGSADLRIYLSCTGEAGRSAGERDGPSSRPDCPVDAGCFPSFPDRVLNRC
jgi:hypothetical protein